MNSDNTWMTQTIYGNSNTEFNDDDIDFNEIPVTNVDEDKPDEMPREYLRDSFALDNNSPNSNNLDDLCESLPHEYLRDSFALDCNSPAQA